MGKGDKTHATRQDLNKGSYGKEAPAAHPKEKTKKPA